MGGTRLEKLSVASANRAHRVIRTDRPFSPAGASWLCVGPFHGRPELCVSQSRQQPPAQRRRCPVDPLAGRRERPAVVTDHPRRFVQPAPAHQERQCDKKRRQQALAFRSVRASPTPPQFDGRIQQQQHSRRLPASRNEPVSSITQAMAVRRNGYRGAFRPKRSMSRQPPRNRPSVRRCHQSIPKHRLPWYRRRGNSQPASASESPSTSLAATVVVVQSPRQGTLQPVTRDHRNKDADQQPSGRAVSHVTNHHRHQQRVGSGK